MTEREKPPACRWAGTESPRLLRTHVRDCNASGCEGCEPCGERHCGTCGIKHVTVELHCPGCVGDVRTNLDSIAARTDLLLTEAVHRGINSEAAHLHGPAADPEQWRQRRRFGHRDVIETRKDGTTYRPDVVGEDHPLWVLGTWDLLVTEHYSHGHRTARITIATAVEYLKANLTDLARDPEFPFPELATDIRRCEAHMEAVLHDGEAPEKGGDCPMCGRGVLVKDYGDTETDDRWRCPRKDCKAAYTEHDYRTKVDAVYVLHAPALTASQIAAHYRVPERTVRHWASEKGGERVHKRGKDAQGRTLYDVEDTLACRDNPGA